MRAGCASRGLGATCEFCIGEEVHREVRHRVADGVGSGPPLGLHDTVSVQLHTATTCEMLHIGNLFWDGGSTVSKFARLARDRVLGALDGFRLHESLSFRNGLIELADGLV